MGELLRALMALIQVHLTAHEGSVKLNSSSIIFSKNKQSSCTSGESEASHLRVSTYLRTYKTHALQEAVAAR